MQPQARRLKREHAGGAYHDPIPIDDSFSNIYSRTGKLRRTGIAANVTASSERTTQQTNVQWNSTTTWSIQDDPEFALDADGSWYDEVVEGSVMHDFVASAIKPKKTRSKVSVRILPFIPHLIPKLYISEMPACGLERPSLSRLS